MPKARTPKRVSLNTLQSRAVKERNPLAKESLYTELFADPVAVYAKLGLEKTCVALHDRVKNLLVIASQVLKQGGDPQTAREHLDKARLIEAEFASEAYNPENKGKTVFHMNRASALRTKIAKLDALLAKQLPQADAEASAAADRKLSAAQTRRLLKSAKQSKDMDGTEALYQEIFESGALGKLRQNEVCDALHDRAENLGVIANWYFNEGYEGRPQPTRAKTHIDAGLSIAKSFQEMAGPKDAVKAGALLHKLTQLNTEIEAELRFRGGEPDSPAP